MSGKDFSDVLDLIVKEDPRYDKAAYFFLRHALDYTMKQDSAVSRPRDDNHVSGPELLEGIRRYALEQYGPMAKTLFDQWGIRTSRDFGEIVFNLVDYGVLGKTQEDRKEDFENVYDFEEVFVKPFLPARKSG